jgi:hypothetical protein
VAVSVRGYTRADGTKVRRYSRRSPGKKAGAGAGAVVAAVLAFIFLSSFGDDASPAVQRQAGAFELTTTQTANDLDCAAHSFGKVREFLRNHPCASLQRQLLEVRDDTGHAVTVATSRVTVVDEATAAALRQLVDAPGTGNVTDLAAEAAPGTKSRFTGRYHVSRTEGSTVLIAEAEPLAGAPADQVIRDAAAAALG